MMATNRTLLEQARELQALAQTGLMYCKDPFDRERYERIRAMAVDMLSTQVDAPAGQVSRLLSAGYPTPKLDTRAAIFDEEGRILMTHENSGEWSLPGGWVDENQSIRSNAVKEVKEETGLDVRGERLIAVQDCANHNALTYDLILRHGKEGEIYNVGGHNEMKNIDIVKLICRELGKPEELITYVEDRKGHDRRYAIDPSKIHRELGWLPETKFADGIKKTIQWYLNNKSWWQNIISGEYQNYFDKMYKEKGRT